LHPCCGLAANMYWSWEEPIPTLDPAPASRHPILSLKQEGA
jgi:hypothetical protein